MNILRYRRPALTGVYVITEGIAWFLVIAVIASVLETAFLDELANRLRTAITANELTQPAAAEAMLASIAEARGRNVGPSLFVVLAAAGGGFALLRLVRHLQLGPGAGSAVLLAATVLGVNVLLHLAIGDLRVWDAGQLIALLEDPAGRSADLAALEAFVGRGDIDGPHANALGFTAIALGVTWVRFMLAARSPIGLDRVARSFTLSFTAVLLALFVAQVGDVAVSGRWAIPQFAAGLLALAIANHERAVPAGEGERRTSPWVTSVTSTLGLLIGAAGVLALLAYLQVGVVISAVGDILLVLVEFALFLIIAPLYWFLERLLSFLLGPEGLEGRLPQIREPLTGEDLTAELESGAGLGLPAWLGDAVAFLAGVFLLWVAYRLGRRLIGRRARTDEEYEEVRGAAPGGAGIGRLLGDIVRLGRRPNRDGWFARHAAYRLFGRALRSAHERGLAMLPAETPAEFGAAAVSHLSAQPVADAARLFERARYGRHFPTEEELRGVGAALDRWEREHPATEELRERVRGVRPAPDYDEIGLRLALARKGIRVEEQRVIQERPGRGSRRRP